MTLSPTRSSTRFCPWPFYFALAVSLPSLPACKHRSYEQLVRQQLQQNTSSSSSGPGPGLYA